MKTSHTLPLLPMGQSLRTRYLMAAFTVSLCTLGAIASGPLSAQTVGPTDANATVLDDGDAQYSHMNFTSTSFLGAYAEDTSYYYAPSVQAGATAMAQWTFTGVQPGDYVAYATWKKHAAFSKDAKYTVKAASWAGQVETASINQSNEPGGATYKNRQWTTIGSVTIVNADDVVVTVKPGSDNTRYTVADAVMIVKTNGGVVSGPSCPTPMCAAAPAGCTYISDSTLGASGCPVNPCGVLKCEPTHSAAPACGDGIVQTGEQCDDGNLKPGDSCSPTCQIKCGDGIVGTGEACDMGNQNGSPQGSYMCTTQCAWAYCGDAITQQNLGEQCDGGTGCTRDCKNAPIQIATCTDSDGGDNPGTKGSATSTNPQAGETDSCIDGTKMKERYCDAAKKLQTKEVTCQYGCADGACKAAPTTSTQCVSPAKTGSSLQNQTNTVDVNKDGVVNETDVNEITAYMRLVGSGGKPSKLILPDVDGKGTIDAQDILYVITYVNCMKPKVALTSAALVCDNGTTKIALAYNSTGISPTGLHLISDASNTPISSSQVDANLTSFMATMAQGVTVTPGTTKARLCHGNNYGLCGGPVTITGAACGVQPACAVPATMKKGTAHQNQTNPYDVNNDGGVTNADALIVTNHLNTVGAGAIPSSLTTPPFRDVNGDSSIDPQDVLYVINYLNSGCGGYPATPTACNPPPVKNVTYQNQRNPLDVDNNALINEKDALTITSHLNTVGAGVPPTSTVAPPYVDVNGDGSVSAIDSLNLINRLNGGCAPPVSTTPAGDLFVTLDSTPTRSRQLLGGTLADTVLRMQFRAQKEDIDVTDLQITSRGSNASSIDRLELYRDGATTAFATATVSGCGTDQVVRTDGGIAVNVFCANMDNAQLVIPKGENLDVLVRPRMKSDEQGAVSGQDIRLFVSQAAVSDNATGQGAIRARGRESNKNLVANDGDATNEGEVFIGRDSVGPNAEITGTRNVVVLSKVTSITNANPDADNTNVPTGVSPVGQFKFTAATNSNTLNGLNKVSLRTLVFTVSTTNVLIDTTSFKLYNKADSSMKRGCVVMSAGGSNGSGGGSSSMWTYDVTCSALHESAIDAELESGESSTFVLETSVTNAQTSTAESRLQASLKDFSLAFQPTSSIEWQDKDAGTATSSIFNWFEYAETVVNSTNYGSAAGHAAATTAPLADNATCNTMPGYNIRNVSNVIAGAAFQATMVMDNPGPSTWTVGANTTHNLTILPETNWGLAAATHNGVIGQPAETQVKPGQVFSFDFYPLTAPSTPGTYPIKIQMKKNGVAFGSVCTHNINVKAAAPAVVLTGDNCPDVKAAKQQMPLFGSAAKFRQTTDGKFLVWAALEGGSSRYVKGVNYDTCETVTFGTAESVYTGIDEISVSDNGKILYKDRNVSGNTNVSKLWLVDKATKAKTLVTDMALSNGTGDRGLISRDGTKVVLTAWAANIDTDPSTTYGNYDGSRELFFINLSNGIISQVTNFNGGQSAYKDSAGKSIPNQYTNMNDAVFEDAAGRFVSVNLDFNPVTGKRHERDVLTTAVQPGDITVWQSRVYLFDIQTRTFYKLSDASNVSNRANFQALIDAKIAEIKGPGGGAVVGGIMGGAGGTPPVVTPPPVVAPPVTPPVVIPRPPVVSPPPVTTPPAAVACDSFEKFEYASTAEYPLAGAAIGTKQYFFGGRTGLETLVFDPATKKFETKTAKLALNPLWTTELEDPRLYSINSVFSNESDAFFVARRTRRFTELRGEYLFRYSPTKNEIYQVNASSQLGVSGIWDPTRKVVYLFGSVSSYKHIIKVDPYDDTKGYTILSTSLKPKSYFPVNLMNSSTVWDTKRNVAYIIGGLTFTPAVPDVNNVTASAGIYEYNPATNEVNLKATMPYSISLPSAVYDSKLDRVLVFSSGKGSKVLDVNPATWAIKERAASPFNHIPKAAFDDASDTTFILDASAKQMFRYNACSAIASAETNPGGFFQSFFARLAGSVLDMANLAGSLLR